MPTFVWIKSTGI